MKTFKILLTFVTFALMGLAHAEPTGGIICVPKSSTVTPLGF